jgi:hypothetical protein
MRGRYAFTLLAVVLAVVGTKLFFFSALPAEDDVRVGLGLGVSKMHQNQNLPVQKMHDTCHSCIQTLIDWVGSGHVRPRV